MTFVNGYVVIPPQVQMECYENKGLEHLKNV